LHSLPSCQLHDEARRRRSLSIGRLPTCNDYGDHPDTAQAIARDLQIMREGQGVIASDAFTWQWL
jgi:hypothetical protein